MTKIPVNGIELNVEVSGNGPALVAIHGFTGSMTTWAPEHSGTFMHTVIAKIWKKGSTATILEGG